MAYRASAAVRTFFADWLKRAREMNIPRDQAAFRDALLRFRRPVLDAHAGIQFPRRLSRLPPCGLHDQNSPRTQGQPARHESARGFQHQNSHHPPGKDRLKPEHFIILAPRLHRIASLQLSLLQKLAGRKKGRS
ncbi:MAG: hypothetical protein QM796_15045 [Chthoniobacteraceae bacterium]